MTKKIKKCNKEDCDNLTYGKLCKHHSYEARKIYTEKGLAQRKYHLKVKYGLTLEEFDLLWIIARGNCSICEQPLIMPTKSKGQPLNAVAIDHDHSTGNVRGLLCNACNKGLGLFKDDPVRLNKAKEYLESCQKEN
jgi:hypothetical protein